MQPTQLRFWECPVISCIKISVETQTVDLLTSNLYVEISACLFFFFFFWNGQMNENYAQIVYNKIELALIPQRNNMLQIIWISYCTIKL